MNILSVIFPILVVGLMIFFLFIGFKSKSRQSSRSSFINNERYIDDDLDDMDFDYNDEEEYDDNDDSDNDDFDSCDDD
ncbi:hypothetical protein JCM13304A_22730 [Desulfothermus okinawensis JCM 13304]